jgi:hypothetical protein
MPADDIVEGVVTFIVDAIKFWLWLVLWNFLIMNLGRFTLLAVTLGRYPKWQDVEESPNRIALAGVFVIFLVWSAIAFNNLVLVSESAT